MDINIKEWKNLHDSTFLRHLDWIKDGTVPLISALDSLSYQDFVGFAKLCIIENNALSAIQYMNKSAETINLLFDIAEGRKFKKLRFSLTEIHYFPNDIYFNAVLNSKNTPEFAVFAQNNILFDEAIKHKRLGEIFAWPEIFLALSYFILEENNSCIYHLERAQSSKTKSASLNGYIEMISGIAQADKSLFLNGAEMQLKWFKRDRESKESIGYPYNFPIMGFINLANSKGLDFSFESPHIHPILIEPLPSDFIYESIPEVYKALEKAENNKRGIVGKIKNIWS